MSAFVCLCLRLCADMVDVSLFMYRCCVCVRGVLGCVLKCVVCLCVGVVCVCVCVYPPEV